MTGLEQLRYTHPQLVDESTAKFDEIFGRCQKVGRDLEDIQKRAERRAAELEERTA